MIEIEKCKYEEMWDRQEYRINSPGFEAAESFFQHFQEDIQEGDSITDFGCGTGAASSLFFFKGLAVQMVDIAENCLDEKLTHLMALSLGKMKFIQASLWDLKEKVKTADWAYCCDVLEHLPEEFIDSTLSQIAKRTTKGGYFQIFLQDEPYGLLVGKKLHLTVKSKDWWIEKIKDYWHIEAFGLEIPDARFSVFVRPRR